MKTTILLELANNGYRTIYTGRLCFGGNNFRVKVEFHFPINLFVEKSQGKSVTEIRRVLKIYLERGGIDIQLSNDEYSLFYDLLMDTVLEMVSEYLSIQKSAGITQAIYLNRTKCFVALLPIERMRILIGENIGAEFLTPEEYPEHRVH